MFATNFEGAIVLRGAREDLPLAIAWEWAEALWSDERVERWRPPVAERTEEPFEPELYRAVSAEARRSPMFMTLGPRPRPNRVVELTPVEMHVETERSRERMGARRDPRVDVQPRVSGFARTVRSRARCS